MSDDSALRDAIRQSRDAFQLMSEGVVFADRHDNIAFANAAAAFLAGATTRDLEGTSGLTLLAAAEELGVEVRKVPRLAVDGRDDGWLAILRSLPAEERDSLPIEHRPIDSSDVLDLVARMELGDDLDDTIQRLCTSIAAMPGLDGAMIMLLPASGDLIYKAHAGPARVSYTKDQRLPLKSAESIIDMTLAGPWVVAVNSVAAWRLFGPLALGLRVAGIRATAYAAMRVGGKMLGVLSVASMAKDGLAILESRLDRLAQVAGVAATMINNQSLEFGRHEILRATVRDCIDTQQFHTVFQPIVQISDGTAFAYEALTRFDDGAAPDAHFRDAHAVGLGLELEVAAARLALDSCHALPADMPIALNFSPEMITGALSTDFLQHPSRPLIVEITEHVQIVDYAGLLNALAGAPHLALAVDDAGAGFASLRHIVELQPKYVKLDIGLIRDLHVDPARAALVAGMCHFARTTGTVLIAEGVGCSEEAEALRALGVDLAQGYHFARPALATTFSA